MSDTAAAGCVGFGGLAALALVGGALSFAYAHHNDHTTECTITGTDRGADDGSYRVYTQECGTLANTDSLWHGKWNSADLQGQLTEGETYTVRIVGWRNGFFSTFPNLIEIQ